jgi:hypothetical protein
MSMTEGEESIHAISLFKTQLRSTSSEACRSRLALDRTPLEGGSVIFSVTDVINEKDPKQLEEDKKWLWGTQASESKEQGGWQRVIISTLKHGMFLAKAQRQGKIWAYSKQIPILVSTLPSGLRTHNGMKVEEFVKICLNEFASVQEQARARLRVSSGASGREESVWVSTVPTQIVSCDKAVQLFGLDFDTNHLIVFDSLWLEYLMQLPFYLFHPGLKQLLIAQYLALCFKVVSLWNETVETLYQFLVDDGTDIYLAEVPISQLNLAFPGTYALMIPGGMANSFEGISRPVLTTLSDFLSKLPFHQLRQKWSIPPGARMERIKESDLEKLPESDKGIARTKQEEIKKEKNEEIDKDKGKETEKIKPKDLIEESEKIKPKDLIEESKKAEATVHSEEQDKEDEEDEEDDEDYEEEDEDAEEADEDAEEAEEADEGAEEANEDAEEADVREQK